MEAIQFIEQIAGEDLELSASIKGKPMPIVTWQRCDKELKSDERYIDIIYSTTFYSLQKGNLKNKTLIYFHAELL